MRARAREQLLLEQRAILHVLLVLRMRELVHAARCAAAGEEAVGAFFVAELRHHALRGEHLMGPADARGSGSGSLSAEPGHCT